MLIHYHPETGRHLGLARLVFIQVKSARECVKFLHGKSVMGKQLNCYIDPFGASCKQVGSLTQHPFFAYVGPYFPKQGRRKQLLICLQGKSMTPLSHAKLCVFVKKLICFRCHKY